MRLPGTFDLDAGICPDGISLRCFRENRRLWFFGAVVGLPLVLLAFFVGTLLPKLIQPEVIASLDPDPRCNLQQGSCRRRLPVGGAIDFSIAPRPIPLVQPLQLKVVADGVELERVEVEFRGLGMNMGINRTLLDRISTNTFIARSELGVCIRNRMEWEAMVEVTVSSGIVTVPFHFVTSRDNDSHKE